ncbi:hypothetical protein O6H91_11G114700 [Diphasiastrum complanatum]|uniref:Uncharacterized protein n=1 Tax=Diphasiastrum complanatum TaxID=34168 RepID=A0ACC2CD47_DIPCM|nr:hypothetical protein O6H91_11G114700 [Diphasiastrum complanatum]
MRLTCLGERNGVVEAGEPACHLLEICDTRLLLECPLDLSALSYFLPTLLKRPEMVLSSNTKATGYDLKHGDAKTSSIPSRNYEPEHAYEHGSSSHIKRQKLLSHSDADGVASHLLCGLMRDWNAVNGSSPYKELDGQILIEAEPWYKTADLGLVDIPLLDAVIISNPIGMLGLPFLTRHPEFSAKIFATDATTKCGQLLIEELLSSHNEYVQLYGRSSIGKAPPWLELKHIAKLPSNIKDALYGVNGSTRANWHPIYSVADVRECIAKISRLHYGEEASVDGILVLKPSSSGFGIGASNWAMTVPWSRLTYIATSMRKSGSAMGLNLSALKGNQILLLSDLQASKMSNANPLATFQKTIGGDVDDPRASKKGSLRIRAQRFWPRRSAIGSTSQPSGDIISKQIQPCTVSPLISAEPLQATAMGSTEGTPQLQSVTSGRFLDVKWSETDIKESISTLAKEVKSAVSAGGCVLIPISPSGLIFELIEEIALELRSATVGHIPMFYVSSAAEELLAYSNIIPEWLGPSRQEKLYAGEALFGIAGLLKEKDLIPLHSLQTPEFLKLWQEPCVVFAAHWGLRMGPAVHLLHRWGKNMDNMLVLLEPSLDIQLALSPFQPLAIQVLRLAVISGLRPKEVPWVIEKLQPMFTLVPEFLQQSLSLNTEVRKRHELEIKCRDIGKTIQLMEEQ